MKHMKKLNELKYGATPLSYDAEDELSDIEQSSTGFSDVKNAGMPDVSKSKPSVYLLNQIGDVALSVNNIEISTAILQLMRNAWDKEFRGNTPLSKAWFTLLNEWRKKLD